MPPANGSRMRKKGAVSQKYALFNGQRFIDQVLSLRYVYAK